MNLHADYRFKFDLNFKYPANGFDCNPMLYYVNEETEKKTKSEKQLVIEKNGEYNIAKFSNDENPKGETIRIEW